MARNLVAVGHPVKIWNRSGGSIDGALMVSSPVDALQCDVILTMLSDDAAIQSVLLDGGALAKAKPGVIHVVMSTISVAFARELVTNGCRNYEHVSYSAQEMIGKGATRLPLSP